ncbi:MAG: HAD family hydrolase [Bdellovibrionaceae bacterium]|jgi:FMN phosphatase YigB (HAD superfamily)|nr:HAD family hydrolase [Pseudobdellovibrionaceae bacterium]
MGTFSPSHNPSVKSQQPPRSTFSLPAWPRDLKLIILDLDDTLLDTTRLLIPIRHMEGEFVRRLQLPLPPMPGAWALLEYLRQHYKLHLLTQGKPAYQQMKIRSLGLVTYFTDFHFVNTQKGESKAQVFTALCKLYPAHQMMSIGNRLSTDLIPAKRLGLWTCWYRYGEGCEESWGSEDEKPDFIVYSHHDILSLCRISPVTL